MWNRLGTKLIPKLRSGSELKAKGGFSGLMHGKATAGFESELRQILEDLGLADKMRIEKILGLTKDKHVINIKAYGHAFKRWQSQNLLWYGL